MSDISINIGAVFTGALQNDRHRLSVLSLSLRSRPHGPTAALVKLLAGS